MLIVEYRTAGPLLQVAFERAPGMVVMPETGYLDVETTHYVFWAEGGDFDAFEAGLDDDPTVAEPRRLAELETRRLYRATSTEQSRTAVSVWQDLDLVMLDAKGGPDGWTFRMGVPDRETLAAFRDRHRDAGEQFDVRSVHDATESLDDGASALTEPQREALLAAYDAGHFDLPQRASQADVAARVGVSPQALSERLKRGVRTLVEEALVDRSS